MQDKKFMPYRQRGVIKTERGSMEESGIQRGEGREFLRNTVLDKGSKLHRERGVRHT